MSEQMDEYIGKNVNIIYIPDEFLTNERFPHSLNTRIRSKELTQKKKTSIFWDIHAKDKDSGKVMLMPNMPDDFDFDGNILYNKKPNHSIGIWYLSTNDKQGLPLSNKYTVVKKMSERGFELEVAVLVGEKLTHEEFVKKYKPMIQA